MPTFATVLLHLSQQVLRPQASLFAFYSSVGGYRILDGGTERDREGRTSGRSG